MIKTIITVLLLAITIKLDTANAVTVQDTLPEGKNASTSVVMTKNEVKALIDKIAQEKAVSAGMLHYIVSNESQYNKDAVGDMNIICKRTGLPVRARGILQITECYYPDISDECAFDIKCSFEKMTPLLIQKETCMSQWTTCRNYYGG